MAAPGPIFLGGTCGRSEWRAAGAVPILSRGPNPVDFINPQKAPGSWDESFVDRENEDKEKCWGYLFVLDKGPSLSLASLVEAAELACECERKGKRLFLVCELFERAGEAGGDAAVAADINRARYYLRDLARRKEIEIAGRRGKASSEGSTDATAAAAATTSSRILFDSVEEACEAARDEWLRMASSNGGGGKIAK